MNDTYITLTGWVGTDVSVHDVAGGQQVANFRVASTTRRLRNNEWVDVNTTWYQIKAWRRLAEHVAASIRRGDPVVVHGRLEANVWTTEDGKTNTQLVVTATSVGHDLSQGTAAFTKPARADALASNPTAPSPAVQSADPWSVPVAEPLPASAAGEPTSQAPTPGAAAPASVGEVDAA